MLARMTIKAGEVFPSSTAVWYDRYYHVDFVIGPEKTDPVGLM
jgi:hypothetical protein